jgi:uridine phosphorylase
MAETENMAHPTNSPLLEHDHVDPPVFLPKSLLEGARRQKRLAPSTLPAGCLLDMDGELVERLAATGRAILDSNWPCFHTRLYRWAVGGAEYGVVGGTVGAPFSVLVAEELFASGCEALVSISSAGLVAPDIVPPFFVLIERALRDEGTSHHYLPSERWAEADLRLIEGVSRSIPVAAGRVLRGASWTTDAPFRETEALIASRAAEGIVCVEMEAAALLTMARALRKSVVCFAHVTNTMATRPEDFEKGGHDGLDEALDVCASALVVAVAEERARRAGTSGEP